MDEAVSAGSDSTPSESSSAPAAGQTIDSALDSAFAELSAPAEPTPQEPAAQAGEVATTEPSPQEPAQSEPEGKGRIHWDDIVSHPAYKTAIEAHERKVSEETEQRILLQLQEDLRPLRDDILFAQNLRANKAQTIAQWLEQQKGDPEVTATIARILSSRRGQKAAAELAGQPLGEEPQPDLQTAEGELVYSAKQLRQWQDWNKRQLLGEVEQQFGPIKESFQQQQNARKAAEDWKQYESAVNTKAQERAKQWDAMPFMEKNQDGTPTPIRAAILKRSSEIASELTAKVERRELRMDPMDLPWTALQQAYAEVVPAQGLPSIQAKQQQQLIQTAVTKARGSQADPMASAPAQPRKPRSIDEALDQAFSAVGGA